MEKGKVRAWYDKSTDVFYMLFKEGLAMRWSRQTRMCILNLMRMGE